MLHPLEQRRLLSVSVSYDPGNGVLSVAGSDVNDHIDVSIQPSGMIDAHSGITGQLGLKPGTFVTVRDWAKLAFKGFYTTKELNRVNVAGGAGDDFISVSNWQPSVRSSAFGEDGNDTIDAFNYNDAPSTRIFGGEGDDILSGTSFKGTTQGYVIWGEGGNDVIYGSTLNDVLYGDDNGARGSPRAGGNDTVYAGDGHDMLYGGDGDDMLCGQAGDDWLCGDSGNDVLDGGSGQDFAMTDMLDKLIDVEEFGVKT